MGRMTLAGGIVVDAADDLIISDVDDGTVVLRGEAETALPDVAAPRRRRGRRAAPAARDVLAAPPAADEFDAILDGLRAEATLVTTFRVEAPPAPRPAAPARRARRRAAAVEGAGATETAFAGIAVPLEPGEEAVLLTEEDGVYSWVIPARVSAATAPAAKKRARRAATGTTAAPAAKRIAHFRLAVTAGEAVPAGTQRRRRGLGSIIRKAVRTIIVKYLGAKLVKGVAKWLERHVAPGLVRVRSLQPEQWIATRQDALPLPADRPARILFLVHGTFSSTAGTFAGMAGVEQAPRFLQSAMQRYDHVIGWDHATLTETPLENATAILDWMQRQQWPHPPEVDAIAFSRGGLVLRSLVERLLPATKVPVRVSRAVFVGCTNSGTELANRANWDRFADVQLNLAAAALRVLAVAPGFTAAGTLLSAAVRGVASLVKGLATLALTEAMIPGLAAMQPDGPFVTELNAHQPGQPLPADVRYYAVTSDFDPDTARPIDDPGVIDPKWYWKVGEKAADGLYRKPNDVVVHVASMTAIDPDLGDFFRATLDFGTNGSVHHCAYFTATRTCDKLAHWLG